MMRIFNRNSQTPGPVVEQDSAKTSRQPSQSSSIPTVSSIDVVSRTSSDGSPRPRLEKLKGMLHLGGPKADTSTVSNSHGSQSSPSVSNASMQSLGGAAAAATAMSQGPREIRPSGIPFAPLKEGALKDAVASLGQAIVEAKKQSPTNEIPDYAKPTINARAAELRQAIGNTGGGKEVIDQLNAAAENARMALAQATVTAQHQSKDGKSIPDYAQPTIDKLHADYVGAKFASSLAQKGTDKPSVPVPPDPTGLAAPKAQQGASPATHPALDKMGSFVGDAVTLHESKIFGQETGMSTNSGMLGVLHQDAQQRLEARLGKDVGTKELSRPAADVSLQAQGRPQAPDAEVVPGKLQSRIDKELGNYAKSMLDSLEKHADAVQTAPEMFGKERKFPQFAKDFIHDQLHSADGSTEHAKQFLKTLKAEGS